MSHKLATLKYLFQEDRELFISCLKGLKNDFNQIQYLDQDTVSWFYLIIDQLDTTEEKILVFNVLVQLEDYSYNKQDIIQYLQWIIDTGEAPQEVHECISNCIFSTDNDDVNFYEALELFVNNGRYKYTFDVFSRFYELPNNIGLYKNNSNNRINELINTLTTEKKTKERIQLFSIYIHIVFPEFSKYSIIKHSDLYHALMECHCNSVENRDSLIERGILSKEEAHLIYSLWKIRIDNKESTTPLPEYWDKMFKGKYFFDVILDKMIFSA